MNIFTSLLRRLGSRKSAPSDNVWTPMGGGSGGINSVNLLEANKEWVFVAVDKIASSVASVRFKVMRYTSSGDDQEVFDGPLVEFLEAPGKSYTGKDFIYLSTVYKELTGNAFWEKLRGNKVAPLVPSRITPVVKDGIVLGFKYTEGIKQRVILAKDVLHDRYIDPLNPHWGTGKLQRIARWVDTSSFVAEFLSKFFVNGASFGGFITTEEETQERINLIKMGLKNDHVGVANAHNLARFQKENGIQAVGEILGYPVYTTDVLPAYSASAVSTKFGVFGNLSQALAWGDRGPMEIAKSDSATVGGKSVFRANQTAMRFTHRHAVAIQLPAAAVVLKTAAS